VHVSGAVALPLALLLAPLPLPPLLLVALPLNAAGAKWSRSCASSST
jgi:hypothetical protein